MPRTNAETIHQTEPRKPSESAFGADFGAAEKYLKDAVNDEKPAQKPAVEEAKKGEEAAPAPPPHPCAYHECANGHGWPVTMRTMAIKEGRQWEFRCPGCESPVLAIEVSMCPTCNEPATRTTLRVDYVLQGQLIHEFCRGVQADHQAGQVAIDWDLEGLTQLLEKTPRDIDTAASAADAAAKQEDADADV